MSREQAEAALNAQKLDGTFILRESSKSSAGAALSVFQRGGVRHFRVGRDSDSVFIQDTDAAATVHHYTSIDLLVRTAGGTVLVHVLFWSAGIVVSRGMLFDLMLVAGVETRKRVIQ
jgi:hypothetical protein